MQRSGFVIIAEKINFFRYLSHFRCVHRGAFFSEMKTTTPRKLLAASWGFLCPVHTPDGAPCGLLNHLAAHCKVITHQYATGHLPALLQTLGMRITSPGDHIHRGEMVVLLDGEVIGFILTSEAQSISDRLRSLKVRGLERVPPTLEIGLTLPSSGPQHPGLYMWSGVARMMRPVYYLEGKVHTTNNNLPIELIGSYEQVYLEIACGGTIPINPTHKEIDEINMLSLVASLTPFSDLNQSPRNMYQCQMGKQTMGTPCHSISQRTDNKLYRIQSPQAPLVRNKQHTEYLMDTFPLGTNAIIAVISYTGYDMEDAMILNKNSYDRGFGHGSIYKSEQIDLLVDSGPSGKSKKKSESAEHPYFFNPKEPGTDKLMYDTLEEDGLPRIGSRLKFGDVFYSYFDPATQTTHTKKYKSKEEGFVDQVRVIQDPLNVRTTSKVSLEGIKVDPDHASVPRVTRANIKMRHNRNPVVGDKFSSRHGQKGIMSQTYPAADMPFTESGITPDVIINPNAFPSRMTIGMLVEILAGKSGALHGRFQDGTPFHFNETNRAIDYFGKELVQAGFNYYGNEPMYSGIYGTELKADIYTGVCYYQRLRHMVSDKDQVRSKGPVNQLTQQPIKGRKVGGGIRLGEMERDSLLAHGVSYILHDRLQICSDSYNEKVCSGCGSIISTVSKKLGRDERTGVQLHGFTDYCRFCETDKWVRLVRLPHVLKYLSVELAAMNVRLMLNVEPIS
eukprot:TRINITY_DN4774_c0_g1_i1.p1 TRINITY_DN4774_c0_g1~~TRINITY_DN4774_c0_g1_i1.p1  ORF type:complete len:731 (-),score=118.78 TRINITY_DN4774_c0_g1_i1:8-2200(-)